MSIGKNRISLVEQYKWINALERLENVTIEAKRLNDTFQFNTQANKFLMSRVEHIFESLTRTVNDIDARINELSKAIEDEFDKLRNVWSIIVTEIAKNQHRIADSSSNDFDTNKNNGNNE